MKELPAFGDVVRLRPGEHAQSADERNHANQDAGGLSPSLSLLPLSVSPSATSNERPKLFYSCGAIPFAGRAPETLLRIGLVRQARANDATPPIDMVTTVFEGTNVQILIRSEQCSPRQLVIIGYTEVDLSDTPCSLAWIRRRHASLGRAGTPRCLTSRPICLHTFRPSSTAAPLISSDVQRLTTRPPIAFMAQRRKRCHISYGILLMRESEVFMFNAYP